MSELKYYKLRHIVSALASPDFITGVVFGDHDEVYNKPDADKVIVAKNKEIARLDDLAHAHNIELLRKENLIAELEEERRWRKFSEEKPEDEGNYLVMARYPYDDELHIEICFFDRNCEDFGHYERRYSGSGNSFGGFDDEEWVTHNVSFWMPLPSAPKEGE